jgi:hypothetical protein
VPRRSPLVTLLAGLVGLQAVGLVGLVVFYLVEIAVATTSDLTAALVSVLLLLLAAIGLGLVARGLFYRRRWARSPTLVCELLVLPVAFGLYQSGRWYVGVPLALWALGILVLLFDPRAALDDE